jgi:hypothetical protein
MQELIDQLKNGAGLSDEQAEKSIEIIKAFIMSKVPPMFSTAVEGFFGDNANGGSDGMP